MSKGIHARWRFNCGEWVSSIACEPERLIAFGTRAGALSIIDWYGADRANADLGSWVGALSVVPSPDAETFLLIAGTKRGVVRGFSYDAQRPQPLIVIGEARGRNTIRSITSLAHAGSTLVAIGSEDKHVRFCRVDAKAPHSFNLVAESSPNGWIRATACGRHGATSPYVAAGCGDKHVYFYTPDAKQYARLLVNAKTHWLAPDPARPLLYAVTDALELLTISTKETEPKIVSRVSCPYRPLMVMHLDPAGRRLAIVCEQGIILDYDHQHLRLLHEMDDLITAAALASDQRGPGVLLGTASGEIGLFQVGRHGESAFVKKGDPAVIRNFDPRHPVDYARARLSGPISSSVKVGIGRFIDVVSGKDGAEVAVIATDEGDVVLADVANLVDEDQNIWGRQNFEQERVWSVAGVSKGAGHYRIWTATSDRQLREFDVRRQGKEAVWSKNWELLLNEWPREIRLVPGTAGEISAACENGDVVNVLDGRRIFEFSGGETFRSVSCQKRDERYEHVAGSDQGHVVAYSNGVETWRHACADRVREITPLADGYAVASEDRNLLILSKRGVIRQRLQLPHRVLCTEVGRPDGGLVYAGCGDGSVYCVLSDGTLRFAYKFPDRIRDIRVLTGGDLLVACEDRQLYLAEQYDAFFERVYVEGEEEFVLELVRRYSDEYQQHGSIDLPSQDVAFALLDRVALWLSVERLPFAADLVSYSLECVRPFGDVRRATIVGHAIAEIGLSFDPAIARAKLREARARPGFDFIVHGMIGVIANRPEAVSLTGRRLHDAMWEQVLVGFEDLPAWSREVCAAGLARSGWTELSPTGFGRFFREVPAPLSMYEALTAEIASIERQWEIPDRVSADVRSLWEGEATALDGAVLPSNVFDVVRQFSNDLSLAQSVQEHLANLRTWLARQRVGDGILSEVNQLLGALETDCATTEPKVRVAMMDRLRLKLRERNPAVLGEEYLVLLLLRAWLVRISGGEQ